MNTHQCPLCRNDSVSFNTNTYSCTTMRCGFRGQPTADRFKEIDKKINKVEQKIDEKLKQPEVKVEVPIVEKPIDATEGIKVDNTPPVEATSINDTSTVNEAKGETKTTEPTTAKAETTSDSEIKK